MYSSKEIIIDENFRSLISAVVWLLFQTMPQMLYESITWINVMILFVLWTLRHSSTVSSCLTACVVTVSQRKGPILRLCCINQSCYKCILLSRTWWCHRKPQSVCCTGETMWNPSGKTMFCLYIIIPHTKQSCWGVYWFHSVHPSVPHL